MTGWSSTPSATQIGSSDVAAERGKAVISRHPYPPAVSPRLRLSTVGDCKREIAKIYREVRRGELASSEATRLVWMLTSLANMIVDHDIEMRVNALERSE